MFALVIRSRSQITLHAAKKVSISYFFSPFPPDPPFFRYQNIIIIIIIVVVIVERKVSGNFSATGHCLGRVRN